MCVCVRVCVLSTSVDHCHCEDFPGVFHMLPPPLSKEGALTDSLD